MQTFVQLLVYLILFAIYMHATCVSVAHHLCNYSDISSTQMELKTIHSLFMLSIQMEYRSVLPIYIYIFVEPFLSARKLLPQRACDRRETWDYYGAPHGECHKGVDRRRVAVPVENAVRLPSLTENYTMFFAGLRTANTRFRIIVTLQRAKRRFRLLASGRADAAANTRVGKED